MKKILFVDDEPHILEGLRNLLRRFRKQWKMSFAEGGEEALKILECEHFDVLVTDMRMPGIDGSELLKIVKQDYPHLVRIVLSGYTELEAAMRAVPVAHQFLTKPCDADHLLEVVERACGLQSLIDDEMVKKIVGKLDKLPSLPKTYSKITEALAQDEVDAKVITAIIEKDMSMCAKILQMVNSAFFRSALPVTNIEFAIVRLGFETVKNLVLGVEIFESAKLVSESAEWFSVEHLQEHSQLSANIARQMFQDTQKSDDAFMAATLHDIGELVLAIAQPRYLQKVYELSKEKNQPIQVIEKKLTGVTHAEIGAYLLGLWGLPYPIVEAVANHHEPARSKSKEFDLVGSSYFAANLASEMLNNESEGDDYQVNLDSEYIDRVEISESQINQWRAIATAEMQHARQAAHG